MPEENELHKLIAAALTGLVKQIKALRYYPPKHPALQTAAEESLRGFKPLFEGSDHLSLAIRKEGFLFDDSPVAQGNQPLSQLATFCFARRIQHLAFLADLNSKDLHHFIRYLLLDPQEILKAGGMQAILEKARVTTVWANIRDLDEILERKEEIEEQPVEPDFDPESVLVDEEEAQAEAQAIDLENLLQRMEQEQDDTRFQHCLQELIPLLRIKLTESNRTLTLRALLLLCRCATGKQYSTPRKDACRQGLAQLANDEMTDFLVAYMFAAETPKSTRETLAQILVFLREQVANRLMKALAGEEQAPRRKLLSDILIRSGASVLPVLYNYLEDDRWYVVRNVVSIMGDIRSQDSLEKIPGLLHHGDIRVRREAIRALTKIGGPKAVNILMQTATDEEQELQRQAILSLGAIRASGAAPTLLSLLDSKDWSQRGIDLKKDTIRALGEIRAPEAIPALSGILGKKRWLYRKLNDELRAAAATALGDIGDESTRELLEKATNDGTSAVARAAALAIKQLNKASL